MRLLSAYTPKPPMNKTAKVQSYKIEHFSRYRFLFAFFPEAHLTTEVYNGLKKTLCIISIFFFMIFSMMTFIKNIIFSSCIY